MYTVGAPGVCIQDNNLYLNIFTVGFSASRFFKFISISGIIEKTVYFQNLRFFSLGTRIHAYSMSDDWRKGKASRRPSHGRYHCPHMAYTNLFIWKLSSSWFCHLVRAFPRDLYIFWTNVNRRRYYRVRRFWHQAPGRWAYPAYRCRQQSGYAQSCRNYAKSPFTRESIGNHYSVGSEVRLFGAIHVQRSLILSLVSTPGGFGNVVSVVRHLTVWQIIILVGGYGETSFWIFTVVLIFILRSLRYQYVQLNLSSVCLISMYTVLIYES